MEIIILTLLKVFFLHINLTEQFLAKEDTSNNKSVRPSPQYL